MSRSRERIEEYLLVAYMSGQLPEPLRKEISAYLARHQEMRELLALAHEALEAAGDDPIFDDSTPYLAGDGSGSGNGDRHGDRALHGTGEPERMHMSGLIDVQRAGKSESDKSVADQCETPRTEASRTASETVSDPESLTIALGDDSADGDGGKPGPVGGKNRMSERHIRRIDALMAMAVLIVGVILMVHIWTVRSSSVADSPDTHRLGVEINNPDATLLWDAQPGAVEYRVVSSGAAGDDHDVVWRTERTEADVSRLDDLADLSGGNTGVALFVEAVGENGTILSRTPVVRLRLDARPEQSQLE